MDQNLYSWYDEVPEKRRSRRTRTPSAKFVHALQYDFLTSPPKRAKHGSKDSQHQPSDAKSARKKSQRASRRVKTTVDKAPASRELAPTSSRHTQSPPSSRSKSKKKNDRGPATATNGDHARLAYPCDNDTTSANSIRHLDGGSTDGAAPSSEEAVHEDSAKRKLYHAVVADTPCASCGRKHLSSLDTVCPMCQRPLHPKCASVLFTKPQPFSSSSLPLLRTTLATKPFKIDPDKSRVAPPFPAESHREGHWQAALQDPPAKHAHNNVPGNLSSDDAEAILSDSKPALAMAHTQLPAFVEKVKQHTPDAVTRNNAGLEEPRAPLCAGSISCKGERGGVRELRSADQIRACASTLKFRLQGVATHSTESFCTNCERENLRDLLAPYRLGLVVPLSYGARLLLSAIASGRTPSPDEKGRIVDPFGCQGFEFRRQAVSLSDTKQLASLVGPYSAHAWEGKTSMLTPSITDRSRKVIACSPAQRALRGGRYATMPLRASSTVPLVTYALDNGEDLNDYMLGLFPTRDPFVTSTHLLCQQLAWHFEDLELHCDKERRDKTTRKQEAECDGVGDRITSLTLRHACWVIFKEKANPKNFFALYLRPGDVYTMSGEARWAWQHGIMLADKPTKEASTRLSIVFRFIEEYPA